MRSVPEGPGRGAPGTVGCDLLRLCWARGETLRRGGRPGQESPDDGPSLQWVSNERHRSCSGPFYSSCSSWCSLARCRRGVTAEAGATCRVAASSDRDHPAHPGADGQALSRASSRHQRSRPGRAGGPPLDIRIRSPREACRRRRALPATRRLNASATGEGACPRWALSAAVHADHPARFPSTMIGIWLSYVQQGRSWGF